MYLRSAFGDSVELVVRCERIVPCVGLCNVFGTSDLLASAGGPASGGFAGTGRRPGGAAGPRERLPGRAHPF
eukprot:643053-Pelagomonas_calceolata.AAC.2